MARFKQYLVFLDRYADLRGDRAAEILTQMGGAVAFLSASPSSIPSRTPYTLELIAAALRLANFTEMRFKHALAARRPNEYSPQVQPIILTPSHSSFPSGHATESFMSAYLLWKLVEQSGNPPYADDSWRVQLMRLASRVAINRTVAGVHFPADSAAGCFLGLALGQYFWRRCTAGVATTYDFYEFDSALFPAVAVNESPPVDGDFYWEEIFKKMFPPYGVGNAPYVTRTAAQGVLRSRILRWLWDKATDEWD